MQLFTISGNYIDLSKPIPGISTMASAYPFGFICYRRGDVSCRIPDRVEYLLTQLVDPAPLQHLADNWRDLYPEFAL